MLGFGADGAPSLVQTRTPPSSVLGIPNIPCSASGYSYTIMKLGPLQFTRKGLSVAKVLGAIQLGLGPDEASVSDSEFVTIARVIIFLSPSVNC